MKTERLLGWAVALVLVLAGAASAQVAPPPLPPPLPSDEFFNPDVLQRVDLLMNSKDWEKLKQSFQENTYYPADMVWNGQTVRNVGIRSRGLGSRSGTKPGLRVDFDRYATDQTFLGLKSFILDNLTQDPSGVKETVVMRFFMRLGIPSPREAHTRLFVNGEYTGLYGLVESVDKTMLERVFGTINGNVQNDGFLFEYNYVLGSPWRFEYEGPALDPYKQRFDPKTNDTKSDAKIWGPIEELARLTSQTPSPLFDETLASRIDLPAFVRYLAAQNFVAQNDGFVGYDGMNNFYFYRLEDSTTHVFIAWDEDNAFLGPDFPIDARLGENVLSRKTLELPQHSSQYFGVLLEASASAGEVAEGQTDGWLRRETERQLDMIGTAMQSDTNKPYSNADHAAAREAMLAFAAARISFVQCDVAKRTGQPLPAGCQ